jgi:hypothetical protein
MQFVGIDTRTLKGRTGITRAEIESAVEQIVAAVADEHGLVEARDGLTLFPGERYRRTPWQLKFVAKMLTASNAYDKSGSPVEFGYEISKSVASGYISRAAASAALAKALAYSWNPYIVFGVSVGAQIGSSIAFKYACDIVEVAAKNTNETMLEWYEIIDGDLRKLYGCQTFPFCD